MRNDMYTVSVVVPAFNAETSIEDCLKSIQNQTYDIHEIIIVDDGSTDDTLLLIKNFSINNPELYIQVIKQENSGPSVARNVGLKLSTGYYIAFLDADDQWLPSKIELQIEVFREYDKVILVSCLCEHSLYISDKTELVFIDLQKLLWGNLFSTPTVMVRKSYLDKLEFNKEQKYSEDYGLWLQLAATGQCVLLNKVLVKLADKPIYGDKGLSSKLWSMEKGELSNYRFLYRKKIIDIKSLIFFSTISLLKYLKREFKTIKLK